MKSPSTGRLDAGVLAQFLEHCCSREVAKRTLLIKVGELCDRIYYLVDGSVEVVIEDDTGNEMVLAYLNRGHFFGEMGFFSEDQATRSAWVRARSDCVLAEMSYPDFQELSVANPQLIVELATQMATRLFSIDFKLGDLAFLDVAGRLAHALLDLSEEPDAKPVDDGRWIQVTQAQLARIVGCSREMVIRVLKTLQSDGLIYNHDGGMVVRHRSKTAADIA